MRWLMLLAAGGCVPAIATLTPDDVQGEPHRGAEVSICRLTAERHARPLWMGVSGAGEGQWDYFIGALLLRRGDTLTVLDPSFNEKVGQDLERTDLFSRIALGDGRTKTPLATLLARAGIDGSTVEHVLLTHVHFDHTGGLEALSAAEVHLSSAEHAFAKEQQGFFEHGVMRHHFEQVWGRMRPFDFDGEPRDGFPASRDVFGDGSVVAVPLPGHTPGSTGYLVKSGGRTYLFSGDATWTLRGVRAPAHRPWFALGFDTDVERAGRSIAVLNALDAHRRDVRVVPAHDGRAMVDFPECAPPSGDGGP